MPIAGLPRGKRSQIFRAVEAILRADPTLSAVVKTWLSYAAPATPGSGAAAVPDNSLEPPFPDACPWVRLSLAPRRIVQADAAAYALPCAVRVEAATAGELMDDQADLWEAILAAMVATKPYLDTTVEMYLRNRAVRDASGNPLPTQGATNWYFEDSGISPAPSREDPAMLVGGGVIVVDVRIPC